MDDDDDDDDVGITTDLAAEFECSGEGFGAWADDEFVDGVGIWAAGYLEVGVEI